MLWKDDTTQQHNSCLVIGVQGDPLFYHSHCRLFYVLGNDGSLTNHIYRHHLGHASQWGEVKGKKKTPKPKTAPERSEFRSQRGGFADRGSRGRSGKDNKKKELDIVIYSSLTYLGVVVVVILLCLHISPRKLITILDFFCWITHNGMSFFVKIDATRGGRGGSTRGAPRAQSGGDRHRKDTEANEWPAASDNATTTTTAPTSSAPSWAQITASSTSAPAPTESSDSWSAPITSTTTDVEPSSTPATTSNDNATESWDAPSTTTTTDSWDTPVASNDSLGASTAPARKINTATIPTGSKMSWAKIVK